VSSIISRAASGDQFLSGCDISHSSKVPLRIFLLNLVSPDIKRCNCTDTTSLMREKYHYRLRKINSGIPGAKQYECRFTHDTGRAAIITKSRIFLPAQESRPQFRSVKPGGYTSWSSFFIFQGLHFLWASCNPFVHLCANRAAKVVLCYLERFSRLYLTNRVRR